MTAVDARPATSGPADAAPAPDWATLVPGGRLGTVVVLGPPTPGSAAALAAGTPVVDGDRADTVVATSDRPDVVAAAVARVRPGGVVRVERSTRRRRRATRRALRRAGFVDVVTWWHRPDIASARVLVRLEDPTAAATVVRTVGDRRRRGPAEALLARTGLADLLAAEVAVMAVAAGGTPEPALAQPHGNPRVDGLVTPRFRRSRAVVAVSTGDDGRNLAGVAKVARRPGDDDGIAHEGRVLEELARRGDGRTGAPAHARLVVRGGRPVLLEAAVRGRTLDRRAVRRDPMGALVAARRWLDTLPHGPASAPRHDGRAAPLLRQPLLAAARRPGATEGTVLGAAEVLSGLVPTPLPVVFEHGDLSHPNLVLTDDGALAAVDWERGRPDGLPLHDLTFLVAYLTESVERPARAADLGRAVVRALSPHGWARAELDIHAEHLGLDRSLVGALGVACWTRRVAVLPAGPGPDGAPHRDVALWSAAVAAATGWGT